MKTFLLIVLFLFAFNNVNGQSITNQNVVITIDGDMINFKLNKENSHKIIEIINIKTKKTTFTEDVNNCNLQGKVNLKLGQYIFKVTTIFYDNRKYVEEKIFMVI